MKTIGFIGSYDKIDMLMCIAKILVAMEKKVLIVDATINQKAKYVVPFISPTKSYVTEFEEFDVAVGFKSFSDIKSYLGMQENEILDYDIALVDVDNIKTLEGFEIKKAEKKYFVTSFDLFSLKKGLETLSGITEQMNITKILFAHTITKEEDDYLNFLSLGYKIEWEKEKIYFPLGVGDQEVIVENQRVSKIKLKKLSSQYKEGLIYISEQILEEVDYHKIKKIFKQLEKSI